MDFLSVWNETDGALRGLLHAKLVMPAALLALFWCWESLHPFFGQTRDRLRHAFGNLAITLLNTAILSFTLAAATLAVARWTEVRHLGLLFLCNLSPAAHGLLALVLLDGGMYLWHRANHVVPFLWRFHRMHHSDPHMDVTTATRFHLGEHLCYATLRIAMVPLFGFAVWHIVLYDLLVFAFTQFHHADISIGRADRWLRWLIVTPFMHKVHHSRERPETDSNYSVILSLWDRMAGTMRMRDDPTTIQFGVAQFDGPQWQTVAGMLKTPFTDSDRQAAPSSAPEPSHSNTPHAAIAVTRRLA